MAYLTFVGERGRESSGSAEPGSAEPGSAETAYFFAFSYKLVESQTFTVLSKLAEARCFPSGLNATRLTTPVGPRKVRTRSPLISALQIRTVLSSPPEATHRPSGLNATPQTWAVWPRRVSCGANARGSPVVVTSQMLTVLSSPG